MVDDGVDTGHLGPNVSETMYDFGPSPVTTRFSPPVSGPFVIVPGSYTYPSSADYKSTSSPSHTRSSWVASWVTILRNLVY